MIMSIKERYRRNNEILTELYDPESSNNQSEGSGQPDYPSNSALSDISASISLDDSPATLTDNTEDSQESLRATHDNVLQTENGELSTLEVENVKVEDLDEVLEQTRLTNATFYPKTTSDHSQNHLNELETVSNVNLVDKLDHIAIESTAISN